MSVTNLTGNQARFVWDVGVSNLTFDVFAIAEWGWERLAIEDDNLLSEMFVPTIPSSLYRLDPMSMSVRYTPTVAGAPAYHTPETGPGNAVKTCRLIMPPGTTGAYMLEGDAYVLRFTMPAMTNNERLNSSVTVQWDPRDTTWWKLMP